MDTGALDGNFISENIIHRYNLAPFTSHSENTFTVCSGLDSKCYDIYKSIPLCVTFFNEILNKNDTFEIEAIILKDSRIDLIIGRTTYNEVIRL